MHAKPERLASLVSHEPGSIAARARGFLDPTQRVADFICPSGRDDAHRIRQVQPAGPILQLDEGLDGSASHASQPYPASVVSLPSSTGAPTVK